MKVLHVIPNLLKGGAQRLVVDICNELLKKKNLECKLIVLSKSKNEFEHISRDLDIIFCNISFNLSVFRNNEINLEQYETIVDNFKPNIIHSHLYFSELVTHQYLRNDVKYISHFHDNIEQFKKLTIKNLSRKILTNYFEKKRLFKSYKKASKVFITISKDNDFFIKSILPKSLKANIYLLRNAINFSNFQQKKTDKIDKIKLINVGNFIEKKNQGFLIDVVKFIHDKGIKVSLDLIGDGVCKEKVYLKAKEMNVTSMVNFVGSVNDVSKYLRNSNFYIHSAIIEPFGLVLLEAMASKVPVISFNGRGNQDLVINGKTGILINELNPKFFGDHIIKLFMDNKRREKLINNAFEFSKNFNISTYSNNLIKIYSSDVV